MWQLRCTVTVDRPTSR